MTREDKDNEEAKVSEDGANTNNTNGTRDTNQFSFIKEFPAGNYEITLRGKRLKSPAEILEKLYLIRNKEKLSDEEKNKEVQNIIREYME